MMREVNKIEECLSSSAYNTDSLLNYLKKKARNHNSYKCYSSLERIVSIRDSKKLYLSTGAKWNDISDRNEFNSPENGIINFGTCFSFSTDESVAMWMLYGGIDKKSGMIDFTKKGIESILSTSTIEFGFTNDNREFVLLKSLNKDVFDLYCIDVVYYKRQKDGYFIKRSEEKHECLDQKVFEGLKICKKAYPWQYENECRLVCSVDRKALPENCTVARIDLKRLDLGKSFERVYHGPNYPLKDTKGTLPSNLDSSIDWSLCDGPCDKIEIKENI
jgi:hypothetical protein